LGTAGSLSSADSDNSKLAMGDWLLKQNYPAMHIPVQLSKNTKSNHIKDNIVTDGHIYKKSS